MDGNLIWALKLKNAWWMSCLFHAETYQRMELEKKKARGQKQIFRGPLIKYISTTMPLIEELDAPQDSGGGSETEINVDDDDNTPPVDTSG